MEVEKRGVKGGFFQLFDWNAKSRKRLFSSKSVSQENSNNGKENFHGSTLARVLQEIDNGFARKNDKDQNHYHCTSSTTIDTEYGKKPPGVVARLMGLDSLPTSHVNESRFNPFIESPSFREANYSRYPPTLQNEEHDIVIFQSARNKLDGLSQNPLDARLRKFQTEALPPKSAKPISITQHRLLSPVKSPRFVPSKNTAYIIEAAAKIMEQSPRANSKVKSHPLGSSYVPLRIHDLKEKTKSDNSTKNTKKRHSAESRFQSADGNFYKGAEESKRVGSQRLRSKEKSVSPAVQAKPLTVQKRDGSTSFDNNRSSLKQNEYNEAKNRNRQTGQKTVENRNSSRKASDVLKLNNQKQNCASTTETEISEPFSSHTRDRKSSSISGQTNRTVNKIVVNSSVTSRKTNIVPADFGKEISSSRAKTNSKKNGPIVGNISSDGSVSRKSFVMKNEKGDMEWDKVDNRNNLDVVSFTFTSPIKKTGSGSNSCSKMSSRSLFDSCDRRFLSEFESSNSVVPYSEFNDVNGDSLSVLLETKLKELSSMIELSRQERSEEGSCSANYYGDVGPTSSSLSNREMQNGSYYPSIDKSGFESGKNIEGDGNNSNFDYQRYNHMRDLSSVCNQFSLSDANHGRHGVDRNLSNDGSIQCLSLESNEAINWISTEKSHADVEISDTGSSFSCSELHYIEYIIHNAEIMSDEFALGLSYKVIPPDFFHQLENQLTESNRFTVNGERFKLEHKALFDCVCECLEDKCDRILAGSKMWSKQTTSLRNRRWLAEEVCREISGWINSEEMMVDEIVNKDMSRKDGQWVDFEVEAFEEGVEIESRIMSSLVDELVDDLLF